jgi:hypothetical protein
MGFFRAERAELRAVLYLLSVAGRSIGTDGILGRNK